MATYTQEAANLHPDAQFLLFFGSPLPSEVAAADRDALLAFMFANFGGVEVDGDCGDDVTDFCAWAIAGNYGSPPSPEQVAAAYPTWKPEWEALVEAAWEAVA